jgi:hypothetical protein
MPAPFNLRLLSESEAPVKAVLRFCHHKTQTNNQKTCELWRFRMRYLLLLSVLLLGTCWAAAQNYPSQSGSTHATGSASTTVEGCLSSNNGNYTLTDSHGNNIALTGDTSKLSEHVGHTIKITGTTTSASTSSSGSAAELWDKPALLRNQSTSVPSSTSRRLVRMAPLPVSPDFHNLELGASPA